MKEHAIPRPDPRLPFSETLLVQLRETATERVTLQELLDGVKSRARATLLILFSLPNLLPGIPGTSAITGLPLVFLAMQMLLGSRVWLPRFIAGRSFLRDDLIRAVTKVQPYLQRIERVLRPRLMFLAATQLQRVVGAVALGLAVLIMLPIPLGNFLPAVAIILIGLGMLEDDGLFMLAGVAVGAISVLLLVTVYWAMILAALKIWITATS